MSVSIMNRLNVRPPVHGLTETKPKPTVSSNEKSEGCSVVSPTLNLARFLGPAHEVEQELRKRANPSGE